MQKIKPFFFAFFTLFLMTTGIARATTSEQLPASNDDNAVTMITNLTTQVYEMIAYGTLDKDPGYHIIEKLNHTKKRLKQGNVNMAIYKLDILSNHLEWQALVGSIDTVAFKKLNKSVKMIGSRIDPSHTHFAPFIYATTI